MLTQQEIQDEMEIQYEMERQEKIRKKKFLQNVPKKYRMKNSHYGYHREEKNERN